MRIGYGLSLKKNSICGHVGKNDELGMDRETNEISV